LPILTSDEIVTTLRRYRRAWFDLNGRGAIYLRSGWRNADGAQYTTITIANVEVIERERRNGVFSDAVAVVERAARKALVHAVFIESVTNPIVSDALARRGYTIWERDGMQVDAYKVIKP
jgi:hypothetical protein